MLSSPSHVFRLWQKKKQGLAAGKYTRKTFSAKNNHGNFAFVVHIFQTTQYLVISRRCFAGKYNDTKCTCRAIVQLIKPFVL